MSFFDTLKRFREPVFAPVATICFIALAATQTVAEESPAAEKSSKPAAAATEEQKDCLQYEPGVVTLKGTVRRPVAIWTLELAEPVCVDKRENDKLGFYPAADDVSAILFWKRTGDSPDKYAEFLNKDVIVTGTLHHKNTGSDMGGVMMMVSRIELAKTPDKDKDKAKPVSSFPAFPVGVQSHP